MGGSASERAAEKVSSAALCERVAVTICTKDRPLDLARAIDSIRASGEWARTVEIIVVEEGDAPRPVAGVRYVYLPRRGLGFGYARNRAVAASSKEIVVFIDDDCEAETGWLQALLEPFRENPAVLGVAGAVLVRDCGLIGYAENVLGFPGGGLRYLHAAQGRVVPTHYLSTCNCAYRRDAILQAGGFVEQAQHGGEDSLLAERISRIGPCRYAPRAVVYHRTRNSVPAVFRWFVRRGTSEVTMLGQTTEPAAFFRYFLRSSWTVRILILAIVLARWPTLVGLVPVAALSYYAALLWRFRFARVYPTHRAAWWLVPVVKLVADIGADLGRWKAVMRTATTWVSRTPS